MTGRIHRDERADRPALIEALAHLPGMPFVLGTRLQVTPREIETNGVAEDASERLLRRNVSPTLAERNDQLDLVLQIASHRRISNLASPGHQGIRRLAEEERRLARIGAHLGRVIGIVAPDAVDATHRKPRFAADNRNDDRRRRREDKIHAKP